MNKKMDIKIEEIPNRHIKLTLPTFICDAGSEIMDSGTDTLGQQIFFEATYDALPAAVVCDCYAMYDLMLRIQDGVMSAHF